MALAASVLVLVHVLLLFHLSSRVSLVVYNTRGTDSSILYMEIRISK